MNNNPTAVYIHIPFCTNKCHYCDFNSYVVQGQPVMAYLHALENEMRQTIAKEPPDKVETIFVGGGTPTVLDHEQMRIFLQLVRSYFPFSYDDVEFTMEANPGTTDLEKLLIMREGGVNRISFGVQAFQNELLSGIGRIHNTDDVYRSIENAKKAGFDNISIDLMFGLPNQTMEMLDESISKALSLDLQHYSIYGLKVEENTLFHRLHERNELPLPSEDLESEMYKLIIDRLRAAGYEHYEISNFAKLGYEGKHNSAYWRNRFYYGLGAGAHGYAALSSSDKEVYGVRHVNIKGIQPYIDAASERLPVLEQHEVSRDEAKEDFMMVGLRLREGISRAHFVNQFGENMDEQFGNQLRDLLQRKLIEETQDGYRLTEQGLWLGNEVFGAFLS